MSDTKQANAMVRMAHRDRTALHGMRDPSVFADEIFGFHAQQAIGKGLKDWMCALGIAYPHSHHINRLLALLSDAGADLAAFRELTNSPSTRIRRATKKGTWKRTHP